jgi:hypothetical protein
MHRRSINFWWCVIQVHQLSNCIFGSINFLWCVIQVHQLSNWIFRSINFWWRVIQVHQLLNCVLVHVRLCVARKTCMQATVYYCTETCMKAEFFFSCTVFIYIRRSASTVHALHAAVWIQTFFFCSVAHEPSFSSLSGGCSFSSLHATCTMYCSVFFSSCFFCWNFGLTDGWMCDTLGAAVSWRG